MRQSIRTKQMLDSLSSTKDDAFTRARAKVMSVIPETGEISRKEIESQTGLPTRIVRVALNELHAEGKVEKTGGGHNVKWKKINS